MNEAIKINKTGIWAYKLLAQQFVPHPIKKVFEFYASAENLNLITPPLLEFKILSDSKIIIKEDSIIKYKLKLHGFPIKWVSKITNWNPPHKFIDTQIKGPYIKWNHLHEFKETSEGTIIHDYVDYIVPGGALIHSLFVKKDLLTIFNYRKDILKTIFDGKE
jgi:ligand-binding SRPBCC domain-containing protein